MDNDVYLVISERSDGNRGIVGSLIEDYGRTEHHYTHEDAQEVADNMTKSFGAKGMKYYVVKLNLSEM